MGYVIIFGIICCFICANVPETQGRLWIIGSLFGSIVLGTILLAVDGHIGVPLLGFAAATLIGSGAGHLYHKHNVIF